MLACHCFAKTDYYSLPPIVDTLVVWKKPNKWKSGCTAAKYVRDGRLSIRLHKEQTKVLRQSFGKRAPHKFSLILAQAAQSLFFLVLGNLPRTDVRPESEDVLLEHLAENEMGFGCAVDLMILQL